MYFTNSTTLIQFALIIILSFTAGVQSMFISDTIKSDTANTQISSIFKDAFAVCQINLHGSDLETTLSCVRNSHFPLRPPVDGYLLQGDFDVGSLEVIANLKIWCFDWTKKSQCLRSNVNVVERCTYSQFVILLELNLAFGDALCSEDGSELYRGYIKFCEHGGIQCLKDREDISEGMMTCVSPLTINHFKRNVNKVTECMEEQLSRCSRDGVMEYGSIILRYLVKFYKSSAKGDSHLFKTDHGDEGVKQTVSDTDDNDKIIPEHGYSIYTYIFFGVAVIIAVALTIVILCYRYDLFGIRELVVRLTTFA